MLVTEETCRLGQQDAPPKPNSAKVPALEEPPPPHHLPIFSHSSFAPSPQGIAEHRQSSACPKDGTLFLAGCLHPTSCLVPHAPKASPSLACCPASAGATPWPSRPFCSPQSHGAGVPQTQPCFLTPLTPWQTSCCCCSSRDLGFVLCALYMYFVHL